MARYQYRYNGIAAWQSQSGNAVIALLNKLGSGKKVLLHSLEINGFTRGAISAGNAPTVSISVGPSDYSDSGEELTLAKLDSNATLPSGISLRRNAIVYDTIPKSYIGTKYYKTGTSSAPTLASPIGPKGSVSKKSKDSLILHKTLGSNDSQPITIRPNESMQVLLNAYTTTFMASCLLSADILFVVSGSPNRTYSWSGIIWALSETVSPLALINNSASNIVYIKEIRIHEIGTLDSPYFRLVPTGSIYPTALEDPMAQLPILKLDSSYPDPTTYVQLIADAPLLPYGVPESYITDSSAGAPKGSNYLHTKDFSGPMYIGIFPEYTFYPSTAGNNSDSKLVGISHKNTSIKGFREPIVIREGESISLVSSAELATGTSAVGTSGWSLFEIGLIFSIEPTQIPVIAATGMIVGSRWYIERVSDGTQITQGVTADGTMSYTYTADDTPLNLRFRVRKGSSAPYYKTYETTFQLTNSGITIPVSQVPDS